LAAKRVEYLKAIVPSLARVALLVNPNDRDGARRNIEESQAAADKLELLVQPVEIRKADDITPAFSQMRSERIDGVIVSQDGLFYATRKNIADLALAHRLPAIVYSRETLEAVPLHPMGLAVSRFSVAQARISIRSSKVTNPPISR
jgi:putative ABC transport system substrate-binding protein